MRTTKTLFMVAAIAALSATSLTVVAQERTTTPATARFVVHPTYCAQWVGGTDRVNDGVPNVMLQSLLEAVASLKHLPSQVAIVEVTDMCKEKLRGTDARANKTPVL